MSRITVEVDGVSYSDIVEPRTLLVQYLRDTQKVDLAHVRAVRPPHLDHPRHSIQRLSDL